MMTAQNAPPRLSFQVIAGSFPNGTADEAWCRCICERGFHRLVADSQATIRLALMSWSHEGVRCYQQLWLGVNLFSEESDQSKTTRN